MRRSFRLQVYGLPEHVHLLLGEPERDTSSGRTAPLKPKDALNGRHASCLVQPGFQGLKPCFIPDDLRGAEAPLFHGGSPRA
jgi:hypothetical protein